MFILNPINFNHLPRHIVNPSSLPELIPVLLVGLFLSWWELRYLLGDLADILAELRDVATQERDLRILGFHCRFHFREFYMGLIQIRITLIQCRF